MEGRLVEKHVVITDRRAISQLVQKGYGKKREGRLYLSLVERFTSWRRASSAC